MWFQSGLTHADCYSVFLNQTANKRPWNAWRRRQRGGGLTRDPVRIRTSNVSGYMLVNTPVNHSVNEGAWVCVSHPISTFMPHPSLERWCLKKSLAANLMAFSGVTSVKFTAAPGRIKRTEIKKEQKKEEKKTTENGETEWGDVWGKVIFQIIGCINQTQISVFDVCSLNMRLKARILCYLTALTLSFFTVVQHFLH